MNIEYQAKFLLKKIYWWLCRPTTFGVKCVIVRHGRILMIKRTFGSTAWVFPGGGRQKGEVSQEAVVREIREDLGVRLEQVKNIGGFSKNVHHRNETIDCFQASIGEQEVVADTEKIRQVQWFEIDELPPLTPISAEVVRLYQSGAKKGF